MLIEFTVKNYRSIKEEQILSLARAKGDELEDTNSFRPEAPSSVDLLRSTAIYGPNAGGKSNVIRAMTVMKFIILNSASTSQEGDGLPVEPFLFNDKSVEDPSEFEMVFISEGTRYQYGFTATQQQIYSEWLFAYPSGRPQRWFARSYNKKTKISDYKFGDFLTGQKSVWKNATRENGLFLSTAVQLNSEQLKSVFSWFRNMLRISNVGGWGSSYTASLCEKKDTKKRVLSFLKAADLDIHDIDVSTEKFDPELLPDSMPNATKKVIIKEMKDQDIWDIKSIHKTDTGKLIQLDFDDESDGTQKLFSFIGPWIDSLEKGYVLVIDELNDNLHPKLVNFLVGLFHSNNSNPNNAQLIFSTHETSILNQEVFRRDQVWFCEKNNEQATAIYPLTDFSPRKDRENIEMGYLSGRYGALPYIRDFELCEEK